MVSALAITAGEPTCGGPPSERRRPTGDHPRAAPSLDAQAIVNLSHDLRTPLHGTIGLTQLLLDTAPRPEQAELVTAIRGCAVNLLRIVDDVLDYARLAAGRHSLETTDFDLRQSVQSVTQVLAPEARAKHLKLTCLLHHDLPTVVAGDPGRLRQILTNLPDNAIKYTDRGEVALAARVVEQTTETATIRFEVRDSGPGISSEAMPHLFEPFFQADRSAARRQGGLGLGLPICRELADLMGGQIGVASAPGEGSTFSLTLPLAKRAEPALPSTALARDLAGVRLLVVDDGAASRASLCEQIAAWGIACRGLPDGLAAPAELRAAVERGQPYDVAILALQGPSADGLEIASAIRRDPALAGVRLVLLDPHGRRDEAARLRALDVAAYLTRPVRPSQLHDSLALVMEARPTDAAAAAPAPAPLVTLHRVAEARGRRRPRVLVAENNPVSQRIAVSLLEQLGCRVDLAASGREAVAAVSRTRYAAVFMDCHMPELDGFAATAEIRHREGANRHTPVIAMTASTLPGDREACERAGMDDYLPKPIGAAALAVVLDRWAPAAKRCPSAPAAPAPATGAAQGRRASRRGRPPAASPPTPPPTLMDCFLQQLPARLAALRQAAAQRDGTALERAAHSLKGDCAYVGLDRPRALCTGLIALARANALDDVTAYVEVIEQELRRARRRQRSRPEPSHAAKEERCPPLNCAS
jgi:CheY-like chemotaxis protein